MSEETLIAWPAKICRACNGRGKAPDAFGSEELVACSACGGKGYSLVRACTRCKGTGSEPPR